MAITSLRARNFQPHLDRAVSFGPEVSTIVGPNDEGKSSLLRALEWVTTGAWHPDYASWGKDKTWVVLGVDGRKVKRVRGKKGNKVALDGKKFAAVRKEVPPEVAALLRVGPENFQRQADPYFWFSLPPGQVAKELNKVVNLQAIDRTLAAVASDLRAAKAEEKVCAARLRLAKVELHNLKRVPEFLARLRAAEAKRDEIVSKGARVADLTGKLETVSRLKETVDRAAGKLSALENALERLGRAVELDKTIGKLENGLKELESVRRLAKSRIPDLSKLDALRDRGEKAAARVYSLELLADDHKAAEEHLCATKGKLEKAEKELLEKTGGRCPACGSPLTRS